MPFKTRKVRGKKLHTVYKAKEKESLFKMYYENKSTKTTTTTSCYNI